MTKINLRSLGFTLIELLVVVAIMGILASIAFSVMVEYRRRGHDAAANQDVRTIATSQEAYYVDNSYYISCTDAADCVAQLDGVDQFTENVVVSSTGDGESFMAQGASSRGSGKTFQFSNINGLTVIE